MNAARLLLVKHAVPDIQPDVPARAWRLGEQGRMQGVRLAEALRPYAPDVVMTSDEPKALETGEIVAEALGLSARSAPGLHELDRTGEPYFDAPGDYERAVKAFFERPTERVFGQERAAEAQQRSLQAVAAALEPYPDKNVVLVAHGIVNALFVAAHNEVDPFTFWGGWAFGTFAVLARPGYGVVEGPRALK